MIADVAEQVGALKQQPGKAIVVMGSSELARSLMNEDLVDEYRLMVHPVVLGAGKRLFGRGPMRELRLVEAAATTSGLATLTYRPA